MNFQNFQIQEIYITAAGETFPAKPLSLDFVNDRYVRAYVQLFDGMGIGGTDRGNGISLSSFKNGCCIFPFDLSPDEDDGDHWDLVRQGTTSVNIQFGQAVPAGGLEVICLAEFDNMITLDRNRQPFIDYRA